MNDNEGEGWWLKKRGALTNYLLLKREDLSARGWFIEKRGEGIEVLRWLTFLLFVPISKLLRWLVCIIYEPKSSQFSVVPIVLTSSSSWQFVVPVMNFFF